MIAKFPSAASFAAECSSHLNWMYQLYVVAIFAILIVVDASLLYLILLLEMFDIFYIFYYTISHYVYNIKSEILIYRDLWSAPAPSLCASSLVQFYVLG